jgi:hypothetical protein
VDIEPGYVGFSRSPDLMGKLIRLGEHLSGGVGEVNHMFVLDENERVIQAEMRGVTNRMFLSDLREINESVTIVKPPPEVRLSDVVKFANSQVGICYGLWTDVGIGIDMVTWQWVPALRGARKPSWICSALGGESLRFGGWLNNCIDIYTRTPQQVKDALLTSGGVVVG